MASTTVHTTKTERMIYNVRKIDQVNYQIHDKEIDLLIAATKGEDTTTLEGELAALRTERDDILQGGGE